MCPSPVHLFLVFNKSTQQIEQQDIDFMRLHYCDLSVEIDRADLLKRRDVYVDKAGWRFRDTSETPRDTNRPGAEDPRSPEHCAKAKRMWEVKPGLRTVDISSPLPARKAALAPVVRFDPAPVINEKPVKAKAPSPPSEMKKTSKGKHSKVTKKRARASVPIADGEEPPRKTNRVGQSSGRSNIGSTSAQSSSTEQGNPSLFLGNGAMMMNMVQGQWLANNFFMHQQTMLHHSTDKDVLKTQNDEYYRSVVAPQLSLAAPK